MKKLFTLLIAFLVVGVMQLANLQAQTVVYLSGSGTYNVPAGVTSMTIECWGAGGAGGSAELTGAVTGPKVRGGGGSGGSYAKATITNPTGSYSYTVGAGGIAPATAFTDGAVGNGGTTNFGTVVVAVGGAGGQSKTTLNVATELSGTGGLAPTSGNTGDVGFIFYGGNGAAALATAVTGPPPFSQGSGAGGGSAGATAAGGDASATTTAGAAGAGGGAAGASGLGNNAVLGGYMGLNPGSGGSGASVSNASNTVPIVYMAGGTGGNGRIKITYTMGIEFSSPANKTLVTTGTVNLTATAVPLIDRTAVSCVFKDGADVIPGEVTKTGNDFSITYTSFPAGKRSITATYTDDLGNTYTSSVRTLYGGAYLSYTGNKYAQSDITWSTGPWYNDPVDGDKVTPPAAGDNVFTQNYLITVAADATCDNFTYGNAGLVSSNKVTINSGVTLTVRGKLDCTVYNNPGVFGNSGATSILKLTGEALTTAPYVLLTDNVARSLTAKNLIIAAADSRAYQMPETDKTPNVNGGNSNAITMATSGNLGSGTGKFTIKNGTNLTLKCQLILGQGADNELIVEEGATATFSTVRGSSSNTHFPGTKATINGTVIYNPGNAFSIKDIVMGANAKFITSAGNKTNAHEKPNDGWWGSVDVSNPVYYGQFATPASMTLTAGSTIEYSRTSAQNINGVILENKYYAAKGNVSTNPSTFTYTTTYPGYDANTAVFPTYSIPFSNINISGNSTKTIQSNLTFSGTLNVTDGTLAIPTGVTLTVQSGATLNIAASKTLTVASGGIINVEAGGRITNSGTITNAGTINFLSDATNGTATFTGTAITGAGTVNVNQSLQHYQSGTLRSWYVSSPVAATIAPTPELSVIKTFDETNANGTTWTDATTLAPKVGYMVTPAAAANNLLFTGALNDGPQSISITRRAVEDANASGFNLIGNPYLSYLDWTEVCNYTDVVSNSSLMPTNTMWYRTKASGSWGFITVNGGVSSPDGIVTKYIPPMQAFWVRAKNVGTRTLKLTNGMRLHTDAVNNLSPNKLKAPAAKTTEMTLVRLQVSNGVNTDEAVIYVSENAQNSFDKLDAPKMSNDDASIPEIYTTLGTEKIVINSMNSVPLNTPIGLGFVAGNGTAFSIKANEISNIPQGVKLMLRDNVTLAETDLTDGTAMYSFAPANTNTDRFSVIFRSAGNTTGVNNAMVPSAQIYVNANNQIVLNTVEKSNYAIYSAVGQLLENGVTTSNFQTANCKLNAGMYVVKINALTTKVIIK